MCAEPAWWRPRRPGGRGSRGRPRPVAWPQPRCPWASSGGPGDEALLHHTSLDPLLQPPGDQRMAFVQMTKDCDREPLQGQTMNLRARLVEEKRSVTAVLSPPPPKQPLGFRKRISKDWPRWSDWAQRKQSHLLTSCFWVFVVHMTTQQNETSLKKQLLSTVQKTYTTHCFLWGQSSWNITYLFSVPKSL